MGSDSGFTARRPGSPAPHTSTSPQPWNRSANQAKPCFGGSPTTSPSRGPRLHEEDVSTSPTAPALAWISTPEQSNDATTATWPRAHFQPERQAPTTAASSHGN